MTHFQSIYKDLRTIKFRLKKTTNRLWKLKFSLVEIYQSGSTEKDFLPRRILQLKELEQLKFEKLVHQLNQIIVNCFNKSFIVFSSEEDVDTILRIRRTIQYMKNAFTSEPTLLQTLEKLNRAIPSQQLRLLK